MQEAMRIHRAEEQGRQAYKVGGTVDAQERVSDWTSSRQAGGGMGWDMTSRRERWLVLQLSTHARTLSARAVVGK
jgi:hypothetical protein